MITSKVNVIPQLEFEIAYYGVVQRVSHYTMRSPWILHLKSEIRFQFVGWLVGFLWHINLCRLFYAKSIFIQIFCSISNNSVKHEYKIYLSKTFLFQAIQFSQTVLIQPIHFSISVDFVYTQLNFKTVLFQTIHFSVSRVLISKTVPFQTIQFCISTQFDCEKHFYFKLFSLVKQL